MTKTGKDIQDDFYRLLKGSSLEQAVSGSVYKNGYRPRDSRLEDITVTFTTATARQVQEGVVTINIFVPDIDPYSNGVWVEDGSRTMALERAALEWFDGVSREQAPMRLRLQETVYTMADADIGQHFIVMRVRFNYLDN